MGERGGCAKSVAMTQEKEFAGIGWGRGYFQGIHVMNRGLYFGRPPRKIHLNRSFFRSAIAVVQIYSYLVGLKLVRKLKQAKPQGTIAFTPEPAAPWHNVWIAAQLGGLKTVNDPGKADCVFVFEDQTHSSPRYFAPGEAAPLLVNNRVNDISKNNVADKFEQVFGYPLRIDPTVHRGKAARKSELNGAHDGVVIDCPIKPEEVLEGHSYQRLVDSTFNGKTSEDLRIAYVFGKIPVVFHKHKELNKRFGTDYLSVDLLKPEQAFTADEIKKIVEFCDVVGLEFGSVDIMRDKVDNRIYIVDVNKTCMPVLSLTTKKQMEAQRKIAQALMATVTAHAG